MTAAIWILDHAPRAVPGAIEGARALVAPEHVVDALGWRLRPEGLCRGDACVPVRDPAVRVGDGRLDLAALAALLDRPVLVDPPAGAVALGSPRAQRRGYLREGIVPSFALADLHGENRSIESFRGTPTLVVVFASWCGCREDLPGWQALQDEIGADRLGVVGVALDQDPAEVAPFAADVRFPVLVDPEHVLTEVCAVSNVPTVVWLDAHGRVARPNSVAFGTDTFAEFHGVASDPHLEAVRRWVDTGEGPRGEEVADLSEEEVEARLWFRLGLHLHRQGDHADAAERFARAAALAPLDFTVARAAMPLTGRDPFGEEFLALYDRWVEAGRPAHALPPEIDLPG